jgi:uncharacterized protein (DUF433 family)
LPKLVKEEIHGEVIEYYPLGEYVVIQPGVQSGLPTIKNTRITAGAILGWLRQGDSPEEVAHGYGISLAAVQEVIRLAEVYDYERSYAGSSSTSRSATPGLLPRSSVGTGER